jgi:hypothetical protein
MDASEVRADAITADTDRETARDLEVGSDMATPGRYTDAVSGYANPGGSQPCPPAPTPAPGERPQPTTCDKQIAPAQPYLSGLALPYAPASCGDNGNSPAQTNSSAPLQVHDLAPTNPLTYPGSASVLCSYGLPKAQGHADQVNTTIAGPLGAPVSAMSATVDATATRTAADGSMATATSTVKDINVGTFLHIAKLTAKSVVRAHGRPGSNEPFYDCEISGLTVTLPPALTLPSGVSAIIPQAPCGDGHVTALTDALNTMFTGQLNISFPPASSSPSQAPGGDLGVVQRASPDGYLSEVALSDRDQMQNAILTNDTSLEEPALVVTYYLDNAYSRNHLVASFAGVTAAARYGIFALDNSNGGGSTGGLDVPLPDSGVVAGALGSGPSGPGDPPTAAAAGPSGSTGSPRATGLAAVPQAVLDGFRFLFQHPEFIPPVLTVWLLFVGPGYLLSRRRALLTATEGGV